MNKYSFTCTCGDKMSVEAATHEEGVQKLKDMMSQEAIDAHMAEKHPGDAAPTMEQVHAQIDSGTMEEPATPEAPQAA